MTPPGLTQVAPVPREPPAVPGVLHSFFLLWEGFHLHDNLSFHSFVTNFTTKATGRAVGVCRSKALMPLLWARPHHHWLPHSSQAATVSRRPRSLRSSVLHSQEPEEAGPAYRFRSALCKQVHTAANKTHLPTRQQQVQRSPWQRLQDFCS